LAAHSARRAIGELVERAALDVVAHIVSSLDDLFGACPTKLRVLYGTDDFSTAAELMGLSARWVRRREPVQLAAATHVLAVSEPLARRWRAAGHAVSVLPNGCDAAAFAGVPEHPVDPSLVVPAPRAVVVGQLSERLDFKILRRLAEEGCHLVLVGPVVTPGSENAVRDLARNARVQWVGPQPFESLPGFLSGATVGLTPYRDTPFNRASFPLKTLEYLAAGLPVVSTDLPAARALGCADVFVAGDAEEFVAHTRRLLSVGTAADDARRRQRFAAGHSWAHRAEELLGLVGIPTG
jgi:teichuronic acid biosynthesis glycosyltransferase TuaH